MACFVVVSGKENLNGIVDSIMRCCPHSPYSPSSANCVSVGKVEADGSYSFRIDDSTKKYPSREEGLINHVSHFGRKVKNCDFKLFFLDNPYGQDDLDQKLFNMVCSVWKDERNGFPRLEVYRVVLDYDLQAPDNTATTASPEAIKAVVEASQSQNVPTLLLENSVIGHSAVFSDKEHHDFRLPRMLADIMLLLSDPEGAGLLMPATMKGQGAHVFSMGHSECMYYADDVHRLIDFYVWREHLKMRLDDPSEDTDDFDFDAHPLGLRLRRDRLFPLYGDPGYSEKVGQENVATKLCGILEGCPSLKGRLSSYCTWEAVRSAKVAYEEAKQSYASDSVVKALEKKFNDLKTNYEKMLEELESVELSDRVVELRKKAEKDIEKTDTTIQTLESQRPQGLFARLVEWLSGKAKRRKAETERLKEVRQGHDATMAQLKQEAKELKTIGVLLKKRRLFRRLNEKVIELEVKLDCEEHRINDFIVTSYPDASSLIDVAKAKAHFESRAPEFYKYMKDEYASCKYHGAIHLGESGKSS